MPKKGYINERLIKPVFHAALHTDHTPTTQLPITLRNLRNQSQLQGIYERRKKESTK